MARLILGLLVVTSCQAFARADLPAEGARPYQLQVVLGIAKHPLLTPVFQQQMQRELRDSLQAALGRLARVEVLRDHPRLKEVEGKGLKHAMDRWNFLDESKLHFLLVSYGNGRYEIQARQYDGFTGLASPVVRRKSIPDPQLVARNAALLIDQDFGLTGTLAPVSGDNVDKVEVTLKGGELGIPLDRWLKKGDVMAVSQIVDQAGAGQASFRMPWTLLQVADEPREGKCPCQLFNRFSPPLPSASGILGYRCLKLGTSRGRLRLRVVSDDKLGTPLNGRFVRINSEGFQGDAQEQLTTNPDGIATSVQPYTNVAFIKVFEGGTALAKIPLEILDDRTITIPVSNNPEAERRGQLYLRRDRWLRRVYDAMDVAVNIVKVLNAIVADDRDKAMDLAKSASKSLESDLRYLGTERDGLIAEAKQMQATLDLSQGEQRIAELEGQQKQLVHYISQLSGILKDEKDPKIQKWKELAEQGKLMESVADYDKAINLYEQVFAAGGEDPALKAHLDELKRIWTLRDDKHRKAHTFIYETWPEAKDAAQMKSLMSEARRAFETCRGYGDWLRTRKLFKVNIALGSKLARELEALKKDTEDERKAVETINGVIEDLKKLNEDVAKFLREVEPAAK